MRRKLAFLAIVSTLCITTFAMLGSGPWQLPPQPFEPDFFSGTITVQGAPAPAGTRVVACVDDCQSVFQSQLVTVEEGGRYTLLRVDPSDRELVGRTVFFYLVNAHGRIQAQEQRRFEGGLNLFTLDLTFNDPLPTPPPPPPPTPTPTPTGTPAPTPLLPVAGDPAVVAAPKLALGIGAGAVFLGAVFLMVARRQAF